MGADNIITLLGGLGAFLFGMHYMGEGLELAAGTRMKDLLEKLTRRPIIGFLVGMLVTVVIQSSAATTVMVMGFINAGIMDLAQATGVIFGANIGTTITSILIALDVSGIAPFCIAAGALLMLYSKRKRSKHYGQIILGFGLLFQGLHTMSESMIPLRESPAFQKFILHAKNPLLGFLMGVLICAVLQSSSASVGILQALAMQGLMPVGFAAYIVCGINVGSSTPPLLSALNARHNAQRAAIIYLIFNVVGAILFVPLAMFTPLTDMIEQAIPNAAFQISLFHILFKVVTGLLLMPFVSLVVKLTYRIIPIQEHESEFRLKYLDKKLIGSPAVMTLQIVITLLILVPGHCFTDVVYGYVTMGVCAYVLDLIILGKESTVQVLVFSDRIEQIGDHALRLMEENEKNLEEKLIYSDEASKELEDISAQVLSLLDTAMACFSRREITLEQWSLIKKAQRKVVRMSSQAQSNHMERLRDKKCTFEQGLTFVESLNSLSRIVNHVANIAETMLSAEVRGGLPGQNVG